MPLEAVVAAVRIQVDAVERPSELGGTLGLGLGSIGLFGRPIAREMGRNSSEWSRGGSSAASRHDATRLVTAVGNI